MNPSWIHEVLFVAIVVKLVATKWIMLWPWHLGSICMLACFFIWNIWGPCAIYNIEENIVKETSLSATENHLQNIMCDAQPFIKYVRNVFKSEKLQCSFLPDVVDSADIGLGTTTERHKQLKSGATESDKGHYIINDGIFLSQGNIATLICLLGLFWKVNLLHFDIKHIVRVYCLLHIALVRYACLILLVKLFMWPFLLPLQCWVLLLLDHVILRL